NNLRDIPSDTIAGKITLAVRLGDRNTRIFYVLLLVGAVVAVPVVCGLGARPLGGIALAASPFAQKPGTRGLGGASGRALIPVLVATGRVQLIFGVLFATGIAISG